MGAAVLAQDVVVEVLDPQRQPGGVTPMPRIASSLERVSVPGSHSNVISRAPVHGIAAWTRETSPSSWRTPM
jgi:hypothetical protein